MRRGLTLGKYAPLHRGHQLVIETALAEMDDVVVIIYEAPETNVPLAVRSNWIRRRHPAVTVIKAWDGPAEVGYAPELMRAHEGYLLDSLKIRDITHFYSSEPYGEHVSRALGAVDRRVDPARGRVPVAARDIRRRPHAYREYLDPHVYRDLVTNVVFLGAPSTGKSTIAGRLAERFHTRWMPEYGREYWEQHQVNRRLTPDQLVEIAEGHLARENVLLGEADGFLFTDTNAMTTATFGRYYHGTESTRLAKLADQAALRYDLVFVCDTDIPHDDTWDRSGDVRREAFQRQVIADLHRRKVPYIMLRGTLEERMERACEVLRRFTKYSNPLSLGQVAAP